MSITMIQASSSREPEGQGAHSPARFLLVGNAPYLNRGCEAIVRGTTRILDDAFGFGTQYLAASFGAADAIQEQGRREAHPRLRHVRLAPKGRTNSDYLKLLIERFCGIKTRYCMHALPDESAGCLAALQVGGDNYSLDYGYPHRFMHIDRELEKQGIPLVLWGASVGPFGLDPDFEREMIRHLSRFRLITVRESRSFRYLQERGLENLVLVADPAFLMNPQPVEGLVLPSAFLGLNLSPITARQATQGDLGKWVGVCASAVTRVLSRIDLPILLIPHVGSPSAENDDFAFLQAVARRIDQPGRVTVLNEGYSAAQVKDVIGRSTIFAGARTHSTIAALSMGVPTLSLAYSAKAWGLNEDVFGHAEHCLDVKALSEQTLASRLAALLSQRDALRRELRVRLPGLRAEALKAGTALALSLNQQGAGR